MSGIFLNSLGINNCLGNDLKAVSKALFADDVSRLESSGTLFSGRSTWVGRVSADLPTIPDHLRHCQGRNNQLLLAALGQIENSVFHFIEKYGHHRVGVVLGTSTSGIAERENSLRLNEHVSYRRQEIGNSALFIAEYLGLSGIRYTVSTACASSKKAMISAKHLLEVGLCDAVIVGGSDSLCELTVNGFDALDSVSPEICNPFSKNRKGINIGEGAALFMMSRDPSPIRVLGTGESSDGFHISSPDPEGKGAALAIRGALRAAQVLPQAVGYVNLHGTGTIKNDEMESKCMNEIFGTDTPASSTKPLIGHTLGAAGAQELGFCYMVLSSESNPSKRLPLHRWDGEVDEQLPTIHLCTKSEYLVNRICMSNSFAFGGSNASVLLGAD
jgi:3-oxoacyl-[acyl-carrier-protein] synthase I